VITSDHRQTVLAIAEAIAPGWERRRDFIEESAAPVREWMVRALAPRPGETLLELAAGAGDCGFEAAAALGAPGRLISTDLSPAMLEVGRRRGAELGVANVEHRVIDAERIELDTGSVDGVLCRFGYMLMAEPARAFAETRRVLRPGGRLVLAVWGAPERNPYLAVLARALGDGGHLPPPRPDGPGVFSMAIEARLRALLEGAGFSAVLTEEVAVQFAVPSIDEYLNISADTAGPFGLALRGLSAPEHDAVVARVTEAFAAFAVDAGYAIPGVALAAVAT
jgi:ubiquinone/menaquinone biosynthesis C-methylase UbiE